MDPLLTVALRGFVQKAHVDIYLQAEAARRRELRLQALRMRRLRRTEPAQGREPGQPES